MVRRTFLTILATIITSSACALRSTPTPSISGYVFRFGVMFGRQDIRVPNAPVILHSFNNGSLLKVVARTRTNYSGEYHFYDVAPGSYYLWAISGPWKFVRVGSTPVWCNIFQEYR